MDDETRDFLKHLFGGDHAPRDIVPGEGLTIEALRRQNDMTGKVVPITIPGEVILDVDGMPIGVEPSTTTRGYFGGTVITQADVDRLGIDPDDFPNIKIMDWPTR